jgi:protein O-GlcNAc transferase
VLKAFLQGLRGGRPRVAAEPLVADEDLAATLPAGLREQLALANDCAMRGEPHAARAPIAKARKEFPQSPWPPLVLALLALREEHAGDAEKAFAAAAALDAAIARDDSVAQHFHTRGLVHLRNLQLPQARHCFEIAHRLYPQSIAPLDMLGYTGYFEGDVAASRRDYDRALALAAPKERGLLRVNRMIDTLPQVYDSAAHVDEARSAFSKELDELLASPPGIADPLSVHRTVFYLCYQGRNDRELNARLAKFFQRACPALGHVAPHTMKERAPGERQRVGFVSMHLTSHSVGAWYRELVRLVIESGRLDCVLFTYDGKVDERLRAAAETHGRHVHLGATLAEARGQIEACALDMLVYTDVGMHPFPYFLSFARLAPVQSLLVGHPCTSGVPAMDFFLSNVHQDTGKAPGHYSERLVRLPSIPVYVTKTPPPARRWSRAECGWDEGRRVYLCPMMLQKLHPDFDWALAEILRRDPQSEVVLFSNHERPLWEARLVRRFAAAMPDVAERITFRPFAPQEEFLNLLLEADCVLDPFHFSGGVTTYIALSLGVPVVTLAGELFRSRMTTGIYAQGRIEGCTAHSREQYVTLALQLAQDQAVRAARSAAIVAAHPRLFETKEAVALLTDWIEHAARLGRKC